jgi:hypothetical protein
LVERRRFFGQNCFSPKANQEEWAIQRFVEARSDELVALQTLGIKKGNKFLALTTWHHGLLWVLRFFGPYTNLRNA